MVKSFRVSELQELLVFTGGSKKGKKQQLLGRVVALLAKESRAASVQTKVQELYR